MRLGGRTGCSCDQGSQHNTCDNRRIKNITRAGDDVVVILDDCSVLRAGVEVVDKSITELDPQVLDSDFVGRIAEAEKSVTALQEKTKLLDNLVDVLNSSGEPSFKAFPAK